MNNITPEEAHEIIKNRPVVIIDVRAPSEFNHEHIPNAQNINVNDATFEEKVRTLDHDSEYVINCQMGGRSAKATELMQGFGFTNVKNLSGGITAWIKAGLPTTKTG